MFDWLRVWNPISIIVIFIMLHHNTIIKYISLYLSFLCCYIIYMCCDILVLEACSSFLLLCIPIVGNSMLCITTGRHSWGLQSVGEALGVSINIGWISFGIMYFLGALGGPHGCVEVSMCPRGHSLGV